MESLKGTLTLEFEFKAISAQKKERRKLEILKPNKSEAKKWNDVQYINIRANGSFEDINVTNEFRNDFMNDIKLACGDKKSTEFNEDMEFNVLPNECKIIKRITRTVSFGGADAIKTTEWTYHDSVNVNEEVDLNKVRKNFMWKNYRIDGYVLTAEITGIKEKKNDPIPAGTYYIRSHKWPEYYVFMQGDNEANVRAWPYDGKHYAEDKWNLQWFDSDDGRYATLNTLKRSNWYAYQQNTNEMNVRGWSGDPGPQGHFNIIRNEECPNTFKLTTRKWPDHYIYMQNTATTNIRGYKGDAGDQGWFVFEKV